MATESMRSFRESRSVCTSKQEEEATKLMESTDEIKKRLAAKEVEVREAKSTLDTKVTMIGNIMHESVTTR
ncbi:unnamed protein product [Miscanthus lutarioriparius]|uniref:Serine-tRNA synthetase type1 N-terminal domain-containing protein n=1 Tax=Miscanthus lutarioriparius TaxID=422564 RepID=A0A811MCI1_9POAL|nr:unnamed protein product [Miscanthus lutarioriparius]